MFNTNLGTTCQWRPVIPNMWSCSTYIEVTLVTLILLYILQYFLPDMYMSLTILATSRVMCSFICFTPLSLLKITFSDVWRKKSDHLDSKLRPNKPENLSLLIFLCKNFKKLFKHKVSKYKEKVIHGVLHSLEISLIREGTYLLYTL